MGIPIFINGFTRGGTSILLNLIKSNPQTDWASGETHEIILGRVGDSIYKKIIKKLLSTPLKTICGPKVFNPRLYCESKASLKKLVGT